ncbi:MAG: FtsX-like permease family protein [Actinomycetota bacterium]
MLRLTLRNLSAHKARFVMTTFAVVLGVSFVVASFVLADGLRSTFSDLSEEITAGQDLTVRPVSEFGEPLPLDATLVDDIIALDDVVDAAGFVQAPDSAIQPIKADGTTIPTAGPPQLMFSWSDNETLSGFSIVDGSAPDEHGEFTMDYTAAETHGFVIGDTYDLITPSGIVTDVELVGTTSFGADNATVGATLMHVSLAQAQDMFGTPGTVDGIVADVAPDADIAAATAAVEATLGGIDAEIVDQATLLAEQQDEFNSGITMVGNILLGFAIVSMFVSIFIIYNTFAIVLGQRVREMALLRAIGAEARQLRRSVVGEALAVGVVASAIGVIAGIGVALGLTELFGLLGAELPEYPLIMAPRTIAIGLALGIGVTVISAVLPARVAASVSPISGLRDGADATEGDGGRRIILGAALTALGVATGMVGLFGDLSLSTLQLIFVLGGGAVATLVGVTMAAPVLARPVMAALGAPLRLTGVSGRLATGNAGRNPRRTATTAAALMIGLSLVTMGYVVGESVKAQFGNLLSSSVTADYLITSDDDTSISAGLADELEASGEFEAVAGFRYDEARLGGEVLTVGGTEISQLDTMFNLDVDQGELPAADATNVVILHTDVATDLGVTIGDVVPIEFVNGYTQDLTVAAIYLDDVVLWEPMVPEAVFDAAGADPADDFIAASLPSGVQTSDVEPLISQIEERYPQVGIETASEFQQQAEATIDSLLLVVNALLALAVIIALIGIANTLALSVHERTREIGLLRAVGMTRGQSRRMIRAEAVLVALFGAVLGVAMGTLFGWGVVEALPEDSFGGTLRIPVASIAVVVAGATLATLLAAFLPARRAGSLNVLDAISH